MKQIDFIQGEIMFLVEHTGKLSPQAIIQKLLDDGIIDPGNAELINAVRKANPNRIITFERPTRQIQQGNVLSELLIRLLRWMTVDVRIGPCETTARYFSVLFVTLARKDSELMQLVQHLDHRVADGNFSRRRRSLESDRLIKPLNPVQPSMRTTESAKQDVEQGDDYKPLQRPLLDNPYNPDFAVMAVSPNWTMSSAQTQLVTGGPGGPSEPAPMNPAHAMTYPQTVFPPRAAAAAPVDVFILDTVPTYPRLDADKPVQTAEEVKRVLQKAYEKWVTDQIPSEQHDILKTLLNPLSSTQLDITMDDCFRDDGKTTLMDYLNDHITTGIAIKDHVYPMTDHGLFIAGIIHSIVPEAHLYLIQVLNDYGVGTTESLLHGLKKVIDSHLANPANPVIVNCSLMMDIPLVDPDSLLERAKIQNTDDALVGQIWATMLSEETPAERAGWFTQWVCDLLTDLGITIVAAAGNDAPDSKHRPQARYPAAFASVQGVAASDSTGLPARYSNVADQPGGDGFIAFGGDGVLPSPLVGKQVAGVYIGDFPPSAAGGAAPTNSTGWGYWSGSSFATPAITGMLARFAIGGEDRQTAVQHGFSSATAATDADEQWVDVTQT